MPYLEVFEKSSQLSRLNIIWEKSEVSWLLRYCPKAMHSACSLLWCWWSTKFESLQKFISSSKLLSKNRIWRVPRGYCGWGWVVFTKKSLFLYGHLNQGSWYRGSQLWICQSHWNIPYFLVYRVLGPFIFSLQSSYWFFEGSILQLHGSKDFVSAILYFSSCGSILSVSESFIYIVTGLQLSSKIELQLEHWGKTKAFFWNPNR